LYLYFCFFYIYIYILYLFIFFLQENVIHISDKNNEQHTYEFDHIYPLNDSQQNIYNEIEPLVISFCDGFNTSLIAYGQTGKQK
jgi:hypothetical protein